MAIHSLEHSVSCIVVVMRRQANTPLRRIDRSSICGVGFAIGLFSMLGCKT